MTITNKTKEEFPFARRKKCREEKPMAFDIRDAMKEEVYGPITIWKVRLVTEFRDKDGKLVRTDTVIVPVVEPTIPPRQKKTRKPKQ